LSYAVFFARPVTELNTLSSPVTEIDMAVTGLGR
jgi:hypothetical protein